MHAFPTSGARWVFQSALTALAWLAVPGLSAASDSMDYASTLLIQIRVANLDRAVAFYRDVLDLELNLRDDDLRWAKFWLPGQCAQIGLGEGSQVEGSGTTSTNIGVSDIQSARRLLESRGVEFLGPTIDIPGVVQLADFHDPDGNLIRLAGPPRSPAAESEPGS